jgi:hypothetical protein
MSLATFYPHQDSDHPSAASRPNQARPLGSPRSATTISMRSAEACEAAAAPTVEQLSQQGADLEGAEGNDHADDDHRDQESAKDDNAGCPARELFQIGWLVFLPAGQLSGLPVTSAGASN